MDKYTYTLKTDKIQKLVRQGDYATAVKICDTMEWAQERNVRLLVAAAETYEKFERDDEATELYLRAYEHSTAGKRILYKLTELALRSNRLQDAETFYRKYLEEAEEDSNRFILRYLIAEAKDEPLQRKIDILEAYHRHEDDLEEKWSCKLAELYQQAGEKEKCVALCDKIILYFAVGPYVERAMELKETFEPLTEQQQDRRDNKAYYEDQVRKIAEEMASIEAAGQILEAADEDAEELARQRSADHMANYTASVDISVIQEIMEEDEEQQPHPGEYEDPMSTVEVIPVGVEDELETAIQTLEAEMSADVPEDEEEIPEAAEEAVEEEIPEAVEETVEEKIPEAVEEAVEEEIPEAVEEAVEEEIPEAVEETVEEEIPEAVEEAVEEEIPEAAEEAVEEDLESTKNLQDTPGWKDVFRQSVEENTDPTKEIVIPRDFIKKAEAGELNVENTTAGEAVEAAPEEVLAQAQEDMPIIAMDEIEQTELENQMEEVPTVAIGFAHDHCMFLVTESDENAVNQAVDALDQYYAARRREMSPIAKIPAEKLNQRGLVHSLPQLNHKDLIVLKASGLSDTILSEILEVIDYLDTDKVFVLMDQEDGINELRLRLMELSQVNQQEDDLPNIQVEETAAETGATDTDSEDTAEEKEISFENISEDQILTKKEFIRYAEYFARELECVIDESGYDVLEDEMIEILKESGKLTAGDVEDLIEDAAEHAEKATIRRMFSSKYNKEGFLILRKRNFK